MRASHYKKYTKWKKQIKNYRFSIINLETLNTPLISYFTLTSSVSLTYSWTQRVKYHTLLKNLISIFYLIYNNFYKMKTFEQFRTWMKNHQAWDEFLAEVADYTQSPNQLYSKSHCHILSDAFPWADSHRGIKYWMNLEQEWLEFYNSDSINYEFKINQIEIASVIVSDLTPAKIGFIKSKLQELHPDITDFDLIDNKIIGYKTIWDLERL